jgi:probable F420-dependent oxidoreductase
MAGDDAHRNRPLRFGLHAARPLPGEHWRRLAQSAEGAGFSALTIPDHLVPTMSPFAGAAAALAATERLHVGTLVLNNDLRHPTDVAREAVSLALLSDGRFELGVGAGHMKSEYDAAGLRFDEGATRVARLVESVAVLGPLLRGESVAVDGEHYRVHADAGTLVAVPPAPVPLLVGGNGTSVLRLAGRSADIAGFAGFSHNHEATEVRLTHFGPDGLADRIDVVRQAAGDRFADIELNALVQAVVRTDDRERDAAAIGEPFGLSAAEVLESPFLLIGTHQQMADALRARRERFGVSYWTVFDAVGDRPSALGDLAEVVALL